MPVPLVNGKGVAWVDAVDHAALASTRVFVHRSNRRVTSYAQFFVKKRGILLHRFVAGRAGVSLANQIDHIDRDGLNCTRGNLRAATASENRRNSARYKNNKSGRRGVWWDDDRAKWVAKIALDGRQRFLGRFSDLDEAARVYDAAAARLHGEFARFNSAGDG